MNKPIKLSLMALLFSLFLPFTLLYAAIPQTLNFQAKLTDKNGAALNGNYQIRFALYDSGGNLLWQETQTVWVQEGVANVILGTVTPLNLNFDQPYWLGLTLQGETLSQRQPLSSSAYSLNSARLQGHNLEEFLIKTPSGNVGIGTANPGYPLEIERSGANASVVVERTDGAQGFMNATASRTQFGSVSNHPLGLLVNSALKMLLDTNGNVGIGTPTPTAKLHVAGSTIIEGSYLKIPVVLSDPQNLEDGMLWYNSTEGAFKCRQQGQVKKLLVQ